MLEPKVILISGKARHGKDYSTNYIKRKLENNGKRVAVIPLAKYIKGYIKDYYGWDGTEETKHLFRDFLQVLGTDIIREKLGWFDFHVKRVCEDIKILSNRFDYFIIPDCRFKNEIYVTLANFPNTTKSIRVCRENFTSNLSKEQQNHISEIDLDNFKMFDFNILAENLEELEEQLDCCLYSLGEDLI